MSCSVMYLEPVATRTKVMTASDVKSCALSALHDVDAVWDVCQLTSSVAKSFVTSDCVCRL